MPPRTKPQGKEVIADEDRHLTEDAAPALCDEEQLAVEDGAAYVWAAPLSFRLKSRADVAGNGSGYQLRLRLFEGVLVLSCRAAAVDRFERALLLAGRSRDFGGAGVAGEGVFLNSFEEVFCVFLFVFLRSRRWFGFHNPFLEGFALWRFGVQRSDDAGRALASVEPW